MHYFTRSARQKLIFNRSLSLSLFLTLALSFSCIWEFFRESRRYDSRLESLLCFLTTASAHAPRSQEPSRAEPRHDCRLLSAEERLETRDLSRSAARCFAFAQSISATKRVRTCRPCPRLCRPRFRSRRSCNHEERIHDKHEHFTYTYCLCFCFVIVFILCCVFFGGVFRPFFNSPVLPFFPPRRALARNVQFVISSLFTSPAPHLSPLTHATLCPLDAGCASLPTRTCFPTTTTTKTTRRRRGNNSLARKIPKRFVLLGFAVSAR